MTVTYLLPLRAEVALARDGELATYLRQMAAHARVLVVDGSPADVFAANAAALGASVTHLAPAPEHRCANGKAWGVMTGLAQAPGGTVVVADDDVRWDGQALARAVRLLEQGDVVVPQNHFVPLPWHAAWDTARTLVNRAVAHDWPGTLVLRRSSLPSDPAYDGDVLFENCELVRTVRAGGGRIVVAADLFVVRRPPSVRHFLGQRPRHAYDDLAQPIRLALFLSIIPALVVGRGRTAVPLAAAAVACAEVGRRRAGGRTVFPWYTAWCAPLWAAERAALSWYAVAMRLSGRGVRYGGSTLLRAATPERVLRRRLARQL